LVYYGINPRNRFRAAHYNPACRLPPPVLIFGRFSTAARGTACAALGHAMSLRPRVVVASPDRSEAALLAEWLLAEGLEPVAVRSLPGAIEEVRSRPFDVLIADARFTSDGQLHSAARSRNARAPLVVLGEGGGNRTGAFHLARPVDQTLFLCHVAMAIVEGRPPRRSVRKRIAPIDALVGGSEVYLIDVSTEGMRFELPRGRLAPPPQFTIKVPLLGIALTVRRAWMSTAPSELAAISWCGAEIFEAHPRSAQNWRSFIDALPTR
jgi:hypothetical protein